MFGASPYINNPYALQYQLPQQTQQTQQPNSNANSGIIWVQGESGAKSYLVAPNNSLLLMDSEDTAFYIKSADQTGMPTLRKFKYTEINAPAASHSTAENVESVNLDNYVTKAELKAELAKIAATDTKKGGADNG